MVFMTTLSQSVMALCLGCSCSVNTSAVAFGSYNPLSTAQVESTGNIAITCQAILSLLDAPYTIALNKGNSTTFSPRKMSNGLNTLNYNLYTSPARTQIWGDNTNGSNIVTGKVEFLRLLQNVTVNHPVYGSIPGSQSTVQTGNYSDTVIVTVTY